MSAEMSVSKIKELVREREHLITRIDVREKFLSGTEDHFDSFRITFGSTVMPMAETSKGLLEGILKSELLMYQEKLAEVENKLISIALLMK